MASSAADAQRLTSRVASWAAAIPVSSKRDDAARIYLPQAIAHRGYKAIWPENSLAAFKDAVRVGAHALETDLHLSEDGVVVISHDPSLKACFGVDRLVSDCTWDYLSSLRTTRRPAQPMARLLDILAWLASDASLNAIWLVLDIKVSNDAGELMAALKRTIESAPSPVPWDQRIVLGCWNASFTQAALSVLPDYSLCHLSLSAAYSRHFLPIPNMGFSVTKLILIGGGTQFLHDVKRGRALTLTWTVNRQDWMDWLIRLNVPSHGGADGAGVLLDGVITDDPKLFLDVCARVQDEFSRAPRAGAHLSNDQDQDPDQDRDGTLLATLRRGTRALGQLLLGSVLRTGHHVLMWYRGYYDYFPDHFLAQLAPPADHDA